MISSVFGKTKPVNYIILLVLNFFLYGFVQLYGFKDKISAEWIGPHILAGICFLFSILLINFIVQRNQITGTHAYVIFFYTLLFLMFPETLRDSNGIFSTFFLLLAVRRLLSLKSLRNPHAKVFDASVWIAVASLFYSWTLLFIALCWVAIYFYDPKDLRNWLIPISGVTTVGLIVAAWFLWSDNLNFIQEHYNFGIKPISEEGFKEMLGLKFIFVSILSLLAGFIAFIKLNKSGHGKIINMRILAIYFLLALLVISLLSANGNDPLIISFFPMALFLSKYTETIQKPKLREIFLIVVLLGSILTFVLDGVL